MSLKKLFSLSLVFTLLTTPTVFADSFKDTNSAIWAQPAIERMVEKGYVGGFPDGTFRPSANISRAELVSIINKMNGFTQEATTEFKDLKSTHWAYSEIKKAVQAGYVSGMPGGNFEPNTPVTREQAATIINNLYKFENTGTVLTLTDQSSLSSWAADSVNAIVSNGIMGGYPDGTFGGKKSITRAECVVVLGRVLDKKHLDSGDSSEAEAAVTEETSSETTTDTTTQTSSGGSSSSSSSSVTTTVPSAEVIKSLGDVVSQMNKYVTPKLSTELQKNTAALMSSSMTNYISDSSYSVADDVAEARANMSNMTTAEATEFKNTVTGNILVSDLQTLNNFFKLVEY